MVIIERETPMRGTGKISKIMRQDGSKEGNEDIRPKMRTGRPFPRHKASRSRQLIRFQESFPKIPTRHQTLCWVPETSKTAAVRSGLRVWSQRGSAQCYAQRSQGKPKAHSRRAC